MAQENAKNMPKKIEMSKYSVFSQFLEGVSEGIYVVGTLASFGAFFFGISVVGAPILVAMAGAGIATFVTIAVAAKYRSNKKRYQALKTAAGREKRAIDSLTILEEERLKQLLQEQENIQAGKKVVSLDSQDELQAEIKSLKAKISVYNQITPPPKAPTTKSAKLTAFYERFYNGLTGFKRSFTLRNVAGTSLLLLGIIVNPPLVLAFTFILGSILLVNRIISRNNEKKIPQETKSVNASAEKIEKANAALRTKIEMSNRQKMGVNETPNISANESVNENKLLNNDVNKVSSSTIKKNKFITGLHIFEGVVEAAYIVGSIFSILSFFLGLAVVGSPLLIAAGAIGSLFFLGASIATKYRADAKSHENLKSALMREESAATAYNKLHPENALKIADIPEKSAKESVPNRFFKLYEYAYQGLAAFKRGFTVRGVIGTTILLTTGLVLNAPVIIAATLIIGTLMTGSRIITKMYEKNKSDKINKANTAAENIEKTNIGARIEKTFYFKKALANEVEKASVNVMAKTEVSQDISNVAARSIEPSVSIAANKHLEKSISRIEVSRQAAQEEPLALNDDVKPVARQISAKKMVSLSYAEQYASFFPSKKTVPSKILEEINMPDSANKIEVPNVPSL